jgi:hypothetical protein
MLGGCFTEALALEREPVSVVHQPIENGIGVWFECRHYRGFNQLDHVMRPPQPRLRMHPCAA